MNEPIRCAEGLERKNHVRTPSHRQLISSATLPVSSEFGHRIRDSDHDANRQYLGDPDRRHHVGGNVGVIASSGKRPTLEPEFQSLGRIVQKRSKVIGT